MSIHKIKEAIETFAPKELAESWDNVGIIIDSKFESERNKILLTIDLTEEVIDEAIELDIKYIVAYHPFIFKSINRICDSLYIKCIKNNISVYCPHTQLDPLMNKFILENIGKGPHRFEELVENFKSLVNVKYLRTVHNINHKKVYNNDGDIISGVGAAFRNPLFMNVLLITGEMSHHDLLTCKKNNADVILLEHSNSERLFLPKLRNLMQMHPNLKEYEILISEKDKDPILII